MSHEVRHNEAARRFEFGSGGRLALLEYRMMQGALALTHTEVPESLEGQGIGSSLTRAALEHARERGLKVLPYCPFAAAYLERHPEYKDLVGT